MNEIHVEIGNIIYNNACFYTSANNAHEMSRCDKISNIENYFSIDVLYNLAKSYMNPSNAYAFAIQAYSEITKLVEGNN